MIKIEKYFCEYPDTPSKTTKDTTFYERKLNWNRRVNKAKEQSEIISIPVSQVFAYVSKFLNMLKDSTEEFNNSSPYILRLDDNNQAIILDNGIICQGSNNWKLPKWNEHQNKYTYWDSKYDVIKEKFNLNYSSDIIWMKFTNKHHLGVVAKSFDINFRTDNNSGKLVLEANEKWDDSFVFIFPLTKDILYKYNKGEIERAIGNYLISEGVPIIDFYSHNY